MNIQQVMEWYDFTGKTAVITGGTGALGSEMASALVGCGANVALLVRDTNLSEELKVALDRGVGNYMVVYGDVLKKDLLEAAVDEVMAAYGRIDILINAAGGNHPEATSTADTPFFSLPQEALGFVFDLNMMGTILPSQVIGQVGKIAG